MYIQNMQRALNYIDNYDMYLKLQKYKLEYTGTWLLHRDLYMCYSAGLAGYKKHTAYRLVFKAKHFQLKAAD